jgi:hypothetical protein
MKNHSIHGIHGLTPFTVHGLTPFTIHGLTPYHHSCALTGLSLPQAP